MFDWNKFKTENDSNTITPEQGVVNSGFDWNKFKNQPT